MKFSIIVPIYNVEAYLDDCLTSLQAQNHTDFEVICVNDGSTDSSREVLSEWKSKFPKMKVIDRKNGGLSAARNTGLDAAIGDYVFEFDSVRMNYDIDLIIQAYRKALDGNDIVSVCPTRTRATSRLSATFRQSSAK